MSDKWHSSYQDHIFIAVMSEHHMSHICSLWPTSNLHPPTCQWIITTWNVFISVTTHPFLPNFSSSIWFFFFLICVSDINLENNRALRAYCDQERWELHFSLTVAEHHKAASDCQPGCVTAHSTKSGSELSFFMKSQYKCIIRTLWGNMSFVHLH